MAFEYECPDDFGGDSKFLDQPGIYHLVVNEVLEGTGPSGKVIDGFCLTLEVLEGTVRNPSGCTELGKTINLTYFNPKLTEKDGGKFTRKKQGKALIAVNQLDPNRKGQKVSINLPAAKGQQLVARFEFDDYNSSSDKKYLNVAGAGLDIWHVDDPHAKSCPKNEKALGLIPKTLRRDEAWFGAIYERKAPTGGSAGNGSSGTQTQTREPATAGAGAGSSRLDLDNL